MTRLEICEELDRLFNKPENAQRWEMVAANTGIPESEIRAVRLFGQEPSPELLAKLQERL